MKLKLGILSVLFLFCVSTFGQNMEATYRIFDGKGNPATLENIVAEISNADVVFLGELHDDSVGHALQFEIFKRVFGNYGEKRKVALSLEMFERDVQIVLDEYLQDLITEKHFLASSRPWGNYETDYRPLVEFAKEKKLKVIAANAPRRYINLVSRKGRDSVNKLSTQAKNWLAPLPFGKSSKVYTEKFNAMMGGHGSENIFDSQTLWDATMAYSISEQLKQKEKSLIIHLNGSFHTANRLGTVEQLLNFQPQAKILVVSMEYAEDFTKFDKSKHLGWGDFVILTDAKQPRSKR